MVARLATDDRVSAGSEGELAQVSERAAEESHALEREVWIPPDARIGSEDGGAARSERLQVEAVRFGDRSQAGAFGLFGVLERRDGRKPC